MTDEDAGAAAIKRTRKLIFYVLLGLGVVEGAFGLAAWVLVHRH